MTAKVSNMKLHRDVRALEQQLKALRAEQRVIALERDPEKLVETARVRLATMLTRYGALIAHLRAPLLEMIEIAAVANNDLDHAYAFSLVLLDSTCQRAFESRVAARRAELAAQHVAI